MYRASARHQRSTEASHLMNAVEQHHSAGSRRIIPGVQERVLALLEEFLTERADSSRMRRRR